MLLKQKQKCGDDNITTLRTSSESHLHWKKHFHKNSFFFEYMQISRLIMRKIILV